MNYSERDCPVFGALGRPTKCYRECGFYNKMEGLCSVESIARHLGRLVDIEEDHERYGRSEKHE